MSYPAGIGFRSGVVGAVFLTLFVGALRYVGWASLDLELLVGGLLTGETTVGTWLLGFAALVLSLGCVGVFYQLGFERIGKTGWDAGLAFSVIHWLAGGALLGSVSTLTAALHPGLIGRLDFPGYYAMNLGLGGFLALLLGTMAYGFLVGALCAPAKRRARTVSEANEERARIKPAA